MNSFVMATTANGLPVFAHNFGHSGPKVLILGGVHGDEIEGVWAANLLLDRFKKNFSYKLQLTICPAFNFEGVLNKERKNPNGVDLNRNLPTNDWTANVATERYHPGAEANSETENQGLVAWLSEHQPAMVISLHSWKPMINTNGNCQAEAEIINKMTGYVIQDSIGYPTPGCLGTYCGLERDMPTITYELEKGMDIEPIKRSHVPAILEALKATEQRR